MEWMNNPLDVSDIQPDSWCGIRICPSKASCEYYTCWLLFCSNNN